MERYNQEMGEADNFLFLFNMIAKLPSVRAVELIVTTLFSLLNLIDV